VTRGLSRATEAERDEYVDDLCEKLRWPDAARTCFARMRAIDELGPCADKLGDDMREALFRHLESFGDEHVTVAIVVDRLAHVHTGIPACDVLVTVVARAFTCDTISLSDRMLLADLIGDFTDATNPRLRARFAALCTKSTGEVRKQTVAAGCRL